jgi:hypothetical protein
MQHLLLFRQLLLQHLFLPQSLLLANAVARPLLWQMLPPLLLPLLLFKLLLF